MDDQDCLTTRPLPRRYLTSSESRSYSQDMNPTIARSIDNIAATASDIGDTVTEALCDDVLAGLTDPSVVYSTVAGDIRYWPNRAINRLLADLGLAHKLSN